MEGKDSHKPLKGRRTMSPYVVIEDQRNLLNHKLVRKGGLEPPRYCYRQPLKLVRLPIPPLPRVEGADAGAPAEDRV
jgi:hypothetical protein